MDGSLQKKRRTLQPSDCYCSYGADALRVENMNLHPGGKQGMLREAFMHSKGLPQSMSFAKDYYNRELAGKPKE